MLNPFQTPRTKSKSGGSPPEKLDNTFSSFAAPAFWFLGYGAQIVLYGTFFAFNARFATTGLNPRYLYATFHYLLVLCSLVSLFGIVQYMGHLSIAKRVVMSVGSIAIFVATYFGFIMLCFAIAMS